MSTTTIKQWLQQICTFPIENLIEIPGDASFRRYYRLQHDTQSFIIMDASQQRDCFQPFAALAQALLTHGVTVPKILAINEAEGFMLISDFGNHICLNELCPENADRLYRVAMDALALMQSCRPVDHYPIPHFDTAFMQRELDEFNLWFLERYLKCTLDSNMLQDVFTRLTQSASQQPQVFIHRDYHSANLMVLPGQELGVLDFQDACLGPITYDLASLLRDCYISWPQEQVKQWVFYFYEKLQERQLLKNTTFTEFMKWFDWMGMQRHMKAIFIFARKYIRDQTSRYLQHIPRALNYLISVSAQYPEFEVLHQELNRLRPTILARIAEDTASPLSVARG
jgi:N-acetylmuramate 1-kinase